MLLEIVTNNVRATDHAKLTTAATFLARGKMVDIEDEILENGFTDNDETDKGTFKDQGYPQFRWESADRARRAADRHGAEDAGAGQRQDRRTPRTRCRC